MSRSFFWVLTVTLLFISGCGVIPGQDDSSQALPTRLVLPTSTAIPQAIPSTDKTVVPALALPSYAWFPNPDDRTILGVNPQNQEIINKILTAFTPNLVTGNEDVVWATLYVDDNTTSLLRMSRQDNTISDDIPLQYGQATSISAAGDYVWLTLKSPASTPGNLKGGVVQVDANQRKIARYIETSGYPLQVSAAPQAAWVLVQDTLTTHFERINPTSGDITLLPANVQDSSNLQLFAHFSVQADGLWATPQQLHAPYVFQIDPVTGNLLATIKVGSSPAEHPIDIAAGKKVIFAALQNNSIVSIDPSTGMVSAPVSIAAPIDRLSVVDDWVWAWSHQAATAYQVDTRSNQVIGSTQLGTTPVPTATVLAYPTASIMGGPFKPCDGVDFESNLHPGMRSVVNPDPPLPDRVRISASSTGKVVDMVLPNQWMDILEGPACVDGKVWWKVHTQNNVVGWTMEGDGIDHWLLPAPQSK